jgi:cation diffusion facilitator CzcD-associated flavoprotein CzcO
MQDHVDVLIVGAGIAGIGMAAHLKRECPGKSFCILERRADLGGTWDLFRYPGIRSDSDMYTMGYEFKPWTDPETLGAGGRIRGYLGEVVAEQGLGDAIRYGMMVETADWSSTKGCWTVRGTDEKGKAFVITAGFYYSAAGYYDYDQGYRPDFAGEKKFKGQIVHPQFWPEDLNYAGKKVVVIGSGATAITLVPAMADGGAAHVTMLQRTPTWIASIPGRDRAANILRKILPEKWVYDLVRLKNTRFQRFMYKRSMTKPAEVAENLLKRAEKTLGSKFDAAALTPPYNPWEQRMCFIPDDDLFEAIKADKAEIVTGHIDTFDATGIKLKSGRHLDADIIVTATGLSLAVAGKVTVSVDGAPVNWHDHYFYKNCMISGVPNFAMVIVYINASATLRVDLVARYICRLFGHMDSRGLTVVTPTLPADMEEWDEPALKLDAGYIQRSINQMPRNGRAAPWRLDHDYFADRPMLLQAPLDDGHLAFARVTVDRAPASAPKAARARKTKAAMEPAE